jgi:hypothetical protein
MAVGQNEPPDFLGMLFEVIEVWRNYIDAEELRIREHHPSVDHDDVVVVTECHRVHSKLAQPTQRHYL